MQLERVVLREVSMPLRQPFVTSFGTIEARRFLIVEAYAEGAVGYGEVAVLGPPLYTEETAETAWHVLEAFLLPIALASPWDHPSALAAGLRPIRRHHHAKAGLEAAVWDLWARQQGKSLAQAAGGTQRQVPSGIALGIAPDLGALLRHVADALEQGYRRIKIKIKPGWDAEPVRAIRRHFGDVPLMADANAAYTLQDAERLRRLDEYGLLCIEQPLEAGDLVDHAKLQALLATPICLDESIESAADARRALELGSCRSINVKLGRLGGWTECQALHALCFERRVPLWCGGMLESGIGRAHNIALASLPGFVHPGDLSASSRYWEEDVVDPPVTLTAEGAIEVPRAPGIGYAVDTARLDRYTLRRQQFLAPGRG